MVRQAHHNFLTLTSSPCLSHHDFILSLSKDDHLISFEICLPIAGKDFKIGH